MLTSVNSDGVAPIVQGLCNQHVKHPQLSKASELKYMIVGYYRTIDDKSISALLPVEQPARCAVEGCQILLCFIAAIWMTDECNTRLLVSESLSAWE